MKCWNGEMEVKYERMKIKCIIIQTKTIQLTFLIKECLFQHEWYGYTEFLNLNVI